MSVRDVTMTMTMALVLAGCGDNQRGSAAAPVDAMADAPGGGASQPAACQAVLSDNFAERWDGPADCARLTTDATTGDGVLALTIPSSYLGAPFEVMIDLGANAGAGSYSSQGSPGGWSVTALQQLELTSCLYQAGAGLVPPGTYTLTLDSVGGAAPHGTLDMRLYVLSRPYTYCGEQTTEHLHVAF